MASPPAKIYILLIVAKKSQLNLLSSALFHLKTRVSLKYFASDCLSKTFLTLTHPRPLQT